MAFNGPRLSRLPVGCAPALARRQAVPVEAATAVVEWAAAAAAIADCGLSAAADKAAEPPAGCGFRHYPA
jgi:hypothetical protein